MRAITIPEPGDADSLVLDEVPDPVAGAGQVLIDVVAAGVNRADVMQRLGHYPPPPGASEYPGLEVSGRIAAVGDGVEQWQVGDEVCALLDGGGYAERAVAPAEQVLPVPQGVSLVDAAGLPEVACTVWSNVFLVANIQPGQVLLVHGGSSGIGTMAIQLAKAVGAHVAVHEHPHVELAKRGAVIATSLRARPATEKAAIVAAVREHVWPLIEAGDVRPVIQSRHPLEHAAEAHREMEASGHIGKILLTT